MAEWQTIPRPEEGQPTPAGVTPPAYNPLTARVPNRGTSERELDMWNQQLRSSEIYQNFMRRNGLPTNGRVKLSDRQQEMLEQELRRSGVNLPGGMHIDQGGNLNQKNRLIRNIAIGAAIGAGAYFGGPALVGALSGGGGGAAGGAAAGAGAGGAAGAGTTAGLGLTSMGVGAAPYTMGAAGLGGVSAASLGTGAAGVGMSSLGAGAAPYTMAPVASTATASGFAPHAATVGMSGTGGAASAAGASSAAASGGSGMWSTLAPYLISGGFNMAGGMMQAGAQANLDRENRDHQMRMLLAQMGVDLEKFDKTIAEARAARGLEAAQQTPNRVGWRQQQAMRAAVMPGLRNVSVQSNIPGMNHFIPQISGGNRIPEGGFGPDVLKFFGENAMLAGEQDLDRAALTATGGAMPVPDYGAFYGDAGRQATTNLNTIAADLKRQDEEASQRQRDALARALGQPVGGGAVRRG